MWSSCGVKIRCLMAGGFVRRPHDCGSTGETDGDHNRWREVDAIIRSTLAVLFTSSPFPLHYQYGISPKRELSIWINMAVSHNTGHRCGVSKESADRLVHAFYFSETMFAKRVLTIHPSMISSFRPIQLPFLLSAPHEPVCPEYIHHKPLSLSLKIAR